MSTAGIDRNTFLAAMRNVASSVTVVTTDGFTGRQGATVSAFSSLSADPPSVLVCLRTESRIARAVASNGVFCVNVLPEGADAIATRFSGRLDHMLPNRFAGLVLRPTATMCPGLPGAQSFACHVLDTKEHASHTIFIGGVAEILPADGPPLAYLNGSYHGLRPQLPESGGYFADHPR